jgi:ABC-type uncharacterized transport system involved in gliding motility auxiliary subunit
MTLTRAARNWWQLAFHVGLFLVGLGLLQVAAERTNHRFDLTPGRQLSLSDVTLKVLRQVTAPLHVTVFYRRGERGFHYDLLRRVQSANPHVTFELFDLDRYPDRAQSLGVTQYGRAAISYGRNHTITQALPEEQLAGGILKVIRGRPRRIAFVTGHGERPPAGGPDGYGRLTTALEAENYVADGMSLLDGPVPPGTDVVVVAGPKHDLLAPELEALSAYLHQGGGVLLLLEPGPLPNLAHFLASIGVRLGDDFIVDRERRVLGTDGLAAVVELFKRGNPISDPTASPIESGAVLPSARTVDVAGDVPGASLESIARTGPSGWAMADPARARRGEQPSAAQHDVPGSASVMVMGELGADGDGTGRTGRLVIVGDADFASDAYLDLLGNRDLAMNAVAWVAGEEAVAGVRPKRVPEILRPLSPLVLTEPQARNILLTVAMLEPGLVLLVGVTIVGWRRRRG